jgi:hypothetical protein
LIRVLTKNSKAIYWIAVICEPLEIFYICSLGKTNANLHFPFSQTKIINDDFNKSKKNTPQSIWGNPASICNFYRYFIYQQVSITYNVGG